MRERPIVFSAPMVRAILDGRKTMTRRVVRSPIVGGGRFDGLEPGGMAMFTTGCLYRKVQCPYGCAGDRLWVRETWKHAARSPVWYRATDEGECEGPWTTPIFMPRWASRIMLEITGLRVERVQEISESDAKAEGCSSSDPDSGDNPTYRRYFQELWESINGKKHPWANNDWVWVITFKRVA